jgi:hypothetical protein
MIADSDHQRQREHQGVVELLNCRTAGRYRAASVRPVSSPAFSPRVEIFVVVDFFLTTLITRLIQKIMQVPHSLFAIYFIIVGILRLHYPFPYLYFKIALSFYIFVIIF